MVTMTVPNNYEDLYTKLLRDNNISFLYETNGENVFYTIKEEDFKVAIELLNNARIKL